MSRQKALIVDDEPDIRELLEITLGRMKLDTRSARNVKEARELLAREPFDLCLTDMRLPDGSGLDLVQYIQQRHPQTPVAMITAYGSLDTAIQALKAGAFDFLTKPVDLGRLRELVATALRLRNPEAEEAPVDNRLLGESPPMRALRNQIGKLARSQAPVYISGESGSGKELVARLIHEQGPRIERPFVPVNCGAIPSELMESEFFGHKKGSFTGAIEDKQGLFQAASGGTLFLDEVADLPMAMQVKLLRAIQEKAVRAVGGQQEVAVDVRILCATHKDLAAEVGAGRFRQDLYYRLNVIELRVPPLRERREDIPLLAERILKRLAGDTGLPAARLTGDAQEKLKNYRFGQRPRAGKHAGARLHPVRRRPDPASRPAPGRCAGCQPGRRREPERNRQPRGLPGRHRAQADHAGARGDPLEPHRRGPAPGPDVPLDALPPEKAGHRLKVKRPVRRQAFWFSLLRGDQPGRRGPGR